RRRRPTPRGRGSLGRAKRAGVPGGGGVAAGVVSAVARGGAAAVLDALARRRAADPSLEHDNPVEEVFEDQIACADLVVLNKRDLLGADDLARASARIAQALPSTVKIVSVADGKIDPGALLGLGIGTEDVIDSGRTHHDDEGEHDHDDFETFAVALPEISDPAALAARVSALAAAHDVFRVKGFVAVKGKPMRLLLQAVGTRVTHQYDR